MTGTEAGTSGAPNGTVTGAEIKTEIEAFLELDEAIAVQKLSLGAKESDIILPDTLEVEVEEADETLAEDMSSGRNTPVSGELSLGASSTMSQYVLPPLLALFNRHYPEIRIRLKSGNTEEIEQAVQDEAVQLGIVEGTARRTDLHYLPFMEDEIILAGGSHAAAPREGLSLPQLSHVPLIMREPGSGTRRVVEEVLKKHGIAASGLHVLMTLGNTESIKMYLAHSPACSFLSSLAVREELKRGDLKKIHLRHLEIRRSFHFANGHGDYSRINELFIKFCRNYYNKI